MAKYKKKPIIVEAIQLRWDTWNDVCEFADVGKLEENKPSGCYIGKDGYPLPDGETSEEIGLLIPTLGGLHVARQNDWIIKGIRGELHPCKPGIFEQTYEVV